MNDDHKHVIINYIKQNVNLSNLTHDILLHDNQLECLNNDKYYFMPNYEGSVNIIIFFKYLNYYYSFAINKRELISNPNDINNIQLIPIKFRTSKKIYDGTVLEGILTCYNNIKKIIVTNVYMLGGKSHTNTNYNKIMNFEKVLNLLKCDDSINDILIDTCKLYNLNLLRTYIKDGIASEINKVNGLIFIHDDHDHKLIYLFDDKDKNDHLTLTNKKHFNTGVNVKNSNVSSNKDMSNMIHKSLNTYDGDKKSFEMVMTDIPDVYKLYILISCIEKNNNKIIKKIIKRYCNYAYVPDIHCSKLCKNLLKDNNKIIVLCTYDEKVKKWKPIKKSDNMSIIVIK